MIKECIILAGGLGTRLRPVVSDVPKCMALVDGKPFLAYVIAYLQSQGIGHFIFSTGYKSEVIEAFVKKNLPASGYQISMEAEPLGTGGAIKLACTKTTQEHSLIINGDTLFCIEAGKLSYLHQATDAHCTLGLKPMQDFDRYGVVELNSDNSVKVFREKQFYKAGLINGGVYALNTATFLSADLPDKFSFEKDYLERITVSQGNRKIYGCVQDKYFIDIGIPEDYQRAQVDLKNRPPFM